ncbi:MAG: hypothetical protein ERJ67_10710 [Aphanocapsa feldmannii 277cV]|uniref:Uncharacterized protein n=1 Tax=Aphanocapsa feldmannii 277cV TaxID=2507553 RepID=A0A524RKW7_9CHRO|nr:MAG: hypothetical protein ERJ67_10710 [Aphanocapsa feldmannii 277cV]
MGTKPGSKLKSVGAAENIFAVVDATQVALAIHPLFAKACEIQCLVFTILDIEFDNHLPFMTTEVAGPGFIAWIPDLMRSFMVESSSRGDSI